MCNRKESGINRMVKKKKEKKLAGRPARYLRGLGHHLKPLVMLGREGLSDNVVNATAAVLEAHELVKVKIGSGCPLDRKDAAVALAEKTDSQVVQVLGKTVLLFRANPDRSDGQQLRLPE
jgi:RNA-binding protein